MYFTYAQIWLVVFFGLVGTIGFCIDTAILYLLKGIMGPFYARAVSFTCSAFTTWVFNRRLTFNKQHSGLTKSREFLSYFLLMLLGGAVNYGVYSVIILNSNFALTNPVIGVAAGSVCGMFVNLLSSKFLLFRHNENQPI